MKKTCIIIVGPTAVGKTALAIELAQHFKTEIISADSRQCFKEINIGVAKPSAGELQLVKHHFINNLSIEEEYTAGRYEIEALSLLQELFEKYDIVVLTGGSGLFIKVLCDGMDDIPAVDPQLREKLNEEYKEHG